eukprot:7002496-Pyramimonas_sp.AAC.1
MLIALLAAHDLLLTHHARGHARMLVTPLGDDDLPHLVLLVGPRVERQTGLGERRLGGVAKQGEDHAQNQAVDR